MIARRAAALPAPTTAAAWVEDDAAPPRVAGMVVPNEDVPMQLANGWRLALDLGGDCWLMTPPAARVPA